MTFVVEFTSKDKTLAEYYKNRFGEEFTKMAALWDQFSDLEKAGVQAAWELEMYREARLQEHYDYTEDDRGRRTPIKENWIGPGANGDMWIVPTSMPKLLIPEVTVKQL